MTDPLKKVTPQSVAVLEVFHGNPTRPTVDDVVMEGVCKDCQ
jgi:Fe2+ or Zn2+ uptake regulation protein